MDKGGMPNLPALMGDLEITQVAGWQSKQERKDVIRSATAGSPALLCRHVIELKSFFTKLGSLHIDKQEPQPQMEQPQDPPEDEYYLFGVEDGRWVVGTETVGGVINLLISGNITP